MNNIAVAEEFLRGAKRSLDINFNPSVVIPGEDVTDLVTGLRSEITIGAGLYQSGEKVFCNLGGMLRYRPPETYWVEANRKRYIPRTGDQVVGLIEERGGDYYRVNIFSGCLALLSRLGFEGATKRNKPELKVGDLIYCRVSLAHKDLDTELTCISNSTSKKDWSSGETVFGQLTEGLLIRVSLGVARKMLHPDSVLLRALGRRLVFEVAVGINGAVWLRCDDLVHSVLIRNAVLNCEALGDGQIEAMVEHLLSISAQRR